MRLLICAGGTGGGVYPALAVLHALNMDVASVMWVGGEGGMETSLVQRAKFDFRAIPSAGVHGVGLRMLPGNFLKLLRGIIASRHILADFKPDVLLFTGGYVAVPMALAGHRIPSLLFVPDIEPGLAIKLISRFARIIAVSTQDSIPFFKKQKNIQTTGYPTRPELGNWTRDEGLKNFSLQDTLPILLVSGGSKGARSINKALLGILPELLEITQVIHLSGELDWDEVKTSSESLSKIQASRYHPYPYLHEEMGAALACADLVVSRAGASTLGELPLFGLPAVLVPYPYAWRYQKVNAKYLTNRGAAILLENDDLESGLKPLLMELLTQPQKLIAMRAAMASLAHPDAASKLANLIKELSGISPEYNRGASW